jgi:membrane fusion protein (multidrug efflux system)
VTVAVPVLGSVNVYGEYVGQLGSPQTVDLRARVKGFLKEIRFQEGSEVEKDTLMFVIDPDEYQVALQKAQAQLLTAEAALAQAKNVKDIEVDRANVARDQAALVNARQVAKDNEVAVAANAMARTQLDSAVAQLKQAEATVEASRAKLAQSEADYQTRVAQAEAQVATAKAAVAEADLNLHYTKVFSPVKGRVGLAAQKVGAIVGDGESTLLATVSLVDPVQVNFTISEREMYTLRKLFNELRDGRVTDGAANVEMILEDGQVYPHKGRIDFADRAVDAGTGTLRLRAEFPNPDRFLRPGSYARIRMVLRKLSDVLLVNERALGADQAGSYLLMVGDDAVVERRSVKIGPKEDGKVVILEGLKAGEQVVVKGLQHARPGSKVNPTREGETVAAPPDSAAPPATPPAAKAEAPLAPGRN